MRPQEQVDDRKPSGDKQMSLPREALQEALSRYTSDTFSDIDTVREFCDRFTKWMLERETELNLMTDIKDRADKIDLSFDHVTKSESRAEAMWEYMKSKFSLTADSSRTELEKELATVLKNTLEGLEKLHHFLDAVERLAVTSLHVFMERNRVLQLPRGIRPESVQAVIAAARLVCPLLLQFKRDASVFFLPSLHNVEVLAFQLDYYISTTQIICERIENSSISDFWQKSTAKMEVHLAVDLSDDDIKNMLCHVNQLVDIRMDQPFRLLFLFQDVPSSGFIGKFSQGQPRMLQFLTNLEDSAVQLDNMKMGAKISSVAGSSVGAVGGVLSIVGLALAPVTAGVSLVLTLTGVGLGITSGVNSAVTTATEIGVNRTYQKKASEDFQNFMKDVQSLQECLVEVSSQTVTRMEVNNVSMAPGVSKILLKVGTIGKGIDSIVDGASAVTVLKSEELLTSAGKVAVEEVKALRNVPKVASDIPDIGQAVAKGPLALSKSARAGFIALNALFLGLDIFVICKDSISLYKGSKSEVSQFIRARAALWRSEIDSWQRIHDSLCKGLLTSKENQTILDSPVYSDPV